MTAAAIARREPAGRRRYAAVRDGFVREMAGTVARYSREAADPDTSRGAFARLRAAAVPAFRHWYRRAYAAGAAATLGLPRAPQISPAAREWADSAARSEAEYWDRFAKQLRDGELRQDPATRIAMYADTLDGAYEAGRVGAAVGMVVHWRVDPAAEHCTTPDARVLTRDLRWVPAGNLKAGDELMAFDEERTDAYVGGHPGRRWRSSTVLSVRTAVADVFEVRLSSGDLFRVTADHLWLAYAQRAVRAGAKTDSRTWYWLRTDRLMQKRKGSRGRDFCARLARVVPVAEGASDFDSGWLAGLFDGEGFVHSSPRDGFNNLAFGQNPGAVLDRALGLLDARGVKYSVRATMPGKRCQTVTIRGRLWERLAFLSEIRAERLISKLNPDWFGQLRACGPIARVVSVTPAGRREIAAVTTTSATLIVEGYPMHNCTDCLLIERSGPYTREGLPCVPRDGTTKCIFNCRCKLAFRAPTSARELNLLNVRGAAVKASVLAVLGRRK